MKRVKVNIKSSAAQVFGRNIKSAAYVLLILFLVSWTGDIILTLVTSIIDIVVSRWGTIDTETKIYINSTLLFICLYGIYRVYQVAQEVKRSDGYDVTSTDHNVDNREIMIMTLSPHAPYRYKAGDLEKESHKLQQFMDSLDYLEPEKDIKSIRKTPFNCNWIPPLQAINHYPKLKKVIVLGTKTKYLPGTDESSKMDKSEGSFDQIEQFKKFVKHYFKNSVREIEVINHQESQFIKKQDLLPHISQGIDADDAETFAKTALEILDSIENQYEETSPNYLEERLVVDVTSGKSSMSASLAAISGSKGIFLHYTDTRTMKSHTLDVNTY